MRFTCSDCGKRIIASDDDAGVCINCGGRNRLEDFTHYDTVNVAESILTFLVAFVLVVLVISKNVKSEEQTIYGTYSNTTIPNLSGDSVTVNRQGNVYRNIPPTTVPDYSKPVGKIRHERAFGKEFRIERLELED